MTLRNPGIAFRALVLAAQGVFYNIFCTFFAYIDINSSAHAHPPISPVVYCFPENLPPFRRLPRGRGRGDIYARDCGARTGPSPYMVRTSWSRAVKHDRCNLLAWPWNEIGKIWQHPPSPRTTGVFLKTRRSRMSFTPCALTKAHTVS
jgi:hypothetical protein